MTEWPLGGREGELDRLERLLAGAGRGAVLAGPPGVGRTRLAVEFLERAVIAGHPTIRVAGTKAGQTRPLSVLASVLPKAEAGRGEGPERLQRYAAALQAQAGANSTPWAERGHESAYSLYLCETTPSRARWSRGCS